MDQTAQAQGAGQAQGPKYFVSIEGKEYPWLKDTITTEEIAQTGGWPVTDGVKQIDEDNVEHDLKPGQIIDLKPGHGFAKKIKWKRG